MNKLISSVFGKMLTIYSLEYTAGKPKKQDYVSAFFKHNLVEETRHPRKINTSARDH